MNGMRSRKLRRRIPLLMLLLVAGILVSCAVNPATGRRMFSLIGESEEIRMGQEADQQIVAQMGLYDDDDLQGYVDSIGQALAAVSERPELPWAFRVLDDEIINAFALPGGYIFVTRGILTHFNTEAELAGVLGHEIGHVTARHSVSQISRAQVLQLGMGIGVALLPELQPYGQLAESTLQLLFLKYSRDNEREADALGFRYMTRAGYDPRSLGDVFTMLGRVSGGEGGRIPGWLSTHPEPEDRHERIGEMIAGAGEDFSRFTVRRDPYLRSIDGTIFGANPRYGFFEETLFYHPDLAFQLRFPPGWTTQNLRHAVQGMSAEEDALLVLEVVEGRDPAAARGAFYRESGATVGRTWSERVNDLDAAWGEFTITNESGTLRGVGVYILHGDAVYRILGVASEERWSAREGAVRSAMTSFRRLEDRAILSVQPRLVEIVRLGQELSFQAYLQRFPSSAPEETVSLVNQIEGNPSFPAGHLLKRLVGGGG
ncbi:MAG: M48 family metalloprotease [Gemmatimonadetes bacterium]|nr:M48 family metalloprotease [Gemmatimonadota bacterium]